MTSRRPIAEFFDLEDPRPDVLVGDDHGSTAPAAVDPDFGGWVDLRDPERPIELEFTPMWFEVVGNDQPAPELPPRANRV